MHSKISWLLCCCFLISTHFSFSQTKNVVGQVFVFNSRSENGKIVSVEDVKIHSPQAKPTFSNKDGRFKLKLSNVVPGMPVFFQIEKKDYEVVDHNNLQYHLMDEKTRLRIFLAKKGYIKKVRFSLMESAKNSLIAEKEWLLERLALGGASSTTALKMLEKKTGTKMTNAHEAEKFVEAWSSDIEERLRLCSYELAIVNPDFSSEIFKSALGHYRRSNLESTIATLQSEDLDGAIAEMKNKVRKVKSHPSKVNQIINRNGRRFDQVKDCYLLQVIALQQSFRLKEAHAVLKKLAEANAIAPTHKHTELIKELDFFKFLEMKEMEEGLVAETFGNENIVVEKSFDEDEKSELLEDEVQPTTSSVVRKSKLIQQPKREQSQEISQNQTLQNSRVENPSDILKGTNTKMEYADAPNSSSIPSPNSTSVPVSNSSSIPTPTQNNPIIVHQSNGQNETIITIKISTSNGNIEQSIEHSKTNPVVVKIENTSPPQSYQLAAKGVPTKKVTEAESTDFETILFPVKNSSSHFKNFVEKKAIQETTKKIHPHINK